MKNSMSKSEYERMELLGAPDGSDSDYTGTLDGDDEEYEEELSSDENEEESPVDEDIEESKLSLQRISRYKKRRGPSSREFSMRQHDPRFKSRQRMPVHAPRPRMGRPVRRPFPRAPGSPMRFAPSGVVGTVTFPASSIQSGMYPGMPLISQDSVAPQNPAGYLMPAAPGTPTSPLGVVGSPMRIGSPVVVEPEISTCRQGPPMPGNPPGSMPADPSGSLIPAGSPGSPMAAVQTQALMSDGPSGRPMSGDLSVPLGPPMSASPPAPPVPPIVAGPVEPSPVSSDDSSTGLQPALGPVMSDEPGRASPPSPAHSFLSDITNPNRPPLRQTPVRDTPEEAESEEIISPKTHLRMLLAAQLGSR